MATSPAQFAPHPVVARLAQLLGPDQVLLDVADREFYAQDVYNAAPPPLAVVRPGTTEELAGAVRACTEAGLAVVPRGGGMSYTDGYLPVRRDSVTFDLARLDRVVAIDVENRYVTVECGATWKQLHDALAPLGARTPYWGPLSGLRSTVGGALSQGSIFLGSGKYGPAAESLLGLDVVLADGTVVATGSHANGKGQPFFRQFGPDLSGLFTGDCGALGVKARATLRLVPLPPASEHLSWGFDDAASLFAAMADVARADVVSECFAFDPGLQKQRMKRTCLKDDAKALGNVIKAAGGGLAGLKAGAKIVAAGRGFLDDVQFSLHLSFDGRDAGEVEAKVAVAKRALGGRGREVENSVPKVMRANPFGEVNSMLGPNGERWVPVHGTVPLSKAVSLYAACEAVFARHRDDCERLEIDHGYLSCTVADRGILLEPVFYWPDARQAFHERVLDPAYLAKLPSYPHNPAARAAVALMRAEIAQVLLEHGAVSFQLGKFYLYQQGLAPSAAGLLASVKQLLDPRGLMNPGSLGLAQGR
jgi:FAD/FMN-containing dehydrogenase